MSNPAVIKLASGKVGKSKVWLDDNYGESIHLHIDDMRVDLTVEEFSNLYSDLCDILNDLVGVENLDFRTIDPTFLSTMLWKELPNIESARLDKVQLVDLLAPFHNKVFKLEDSVGVRALKGDSKIGLGNRKSNLISQTEHERMSELLESVREHGYPYNHHYIILYGDDNIIRDGQHRASCLYYLEGNKEIPVLRLYLRNYKSPAIHKYYNSFIFSFIRMSRARVAAFGVRIIGILKGVKKAFK